MPGDHRRSSDLAAPLYRALHVIDDSGCGTDATGNLESSVIRWAHDTRRRPPPSASLVCMELRHRASSGRRRGWARRVSGVSERQPILCPACHFAPRTPECDVRVDDAKSQEGVGLGEFRVSGVCGLYGSPSEMDLDTPQLQAYRPVLKAGTDAEMAGTTGLEPATSDVTGRRRRSGEQELCLIVNSLRESRGTLSEAATVRATVLDEHFMLVLAYSRSSG